jgi:prolyl-tRNA synthetase
LWRESGRYDAYGEEMLDQRPWRARYAVVRMTAEGAGYRYFRHARQHKDLPLTLYQISGNSAASSSALGVMRGRRYMEDGYNFDHINQRGRAARITAIW